MRCMGYLSLLNFQWKWKQLCLLICVFIVTNAESLEEAWTRGMKGRLQQAKKRGPHFRVTRIISFQASSVRQYEITVSREDTNEAINCSVTARVSMTNNNAEETNSNVMRIWDSGA